MLRLRPKIQNPNTTTLNPSKAAATGPKALDVQLLLAKLKGPLAKSWALQGFLSQRVRVPMHHKLGAQGVLGLGA